MTEFFAFFVKGILLGLSIAAPVGPIGILCIRRTLAKGHVVGLASGLGAATADALYGCIAGFGLTLIADFLVSQQLWLSLIGGIFLLYLGLKTIFTKPAKQNTTDKVHGLAGAYASTLFLTLTNPMTILSFAAIFAGLGLTNTRGNFLSAGFLVSGVFVGSALWWLLLSAGVVRFREKLDAAGLKWVNRMAGAMIAGFGVFALLEAYS